MEDKCNTGDTVYLDKAGKKISYEKYKKLQGTEEAAGEPEAIEQPEQAERETNP